MGGTTELKGPDLSLGVSALDVIEARPFLGHAYGEAVILVRSGGKLFATGATCTHYSGPLAEGLVVGKTVHCPWHHACFDLETGLAAGVVMGSLMQLRIAGRVRCDLHGRYAAM